MATVLDTDVVVVGHGVAGLSAAVAAAEAGAKVVVLERAPFEEFGGNSRWTEAYMRMKNEHEVADDFEEHFAENAGKNLDPIIVNGAVDDYGQWPSIVKAHQFIDPELIGFFADSAPGALAWLRRFGCRFEPMPIYLLTQNTTRIASVGGGLAILEALHKQGSKLGVSYQYRTTARNLIQNEDGRVIGIKAVSTELGPLEINAGAVVLACGGYQGNPEMMTSYMGPKAAAIRPVARGGYYNKGDGHRMALAAGAAPAGEYGSYHAEPVDPRSSMAEAVIFIYPYGILVNRDGRRFLDEAPGTVDAHYDNITRSIGEQPDGISYVIFDRKVEDIPRWQTSIRSDQPAIQAETLEDLARALNLPVGSFVETISQYNAACPSAAGFTDGLSLDNLKTSGLWPVKSNHARAIDKGPFSAYPIVSANCFTFGGLKVNTRAEVLDCDGRVIPGLLAAGETVGIYHQVYTGSTSVLRGIVFGRRAGESAAAK
ncbi:MAG: FAD-dependent oxidoreductase [Burkholderiaceae bacterium]|jgi:tricarballylate dehydrogenase|nr:FAD-dependent oxidoreductase [Burkholderiaceae bacterium]